MDVTCERCGTEYEFDETLLSARGTSVKCTNCGHVFKVYPKAAQEADRTTSSWQLKTGDGSVDTIDTLRELQRRISSGELTPDDEIARGEEGWKTLGSIPELETFFQAAGIPIHSDRIPSPIPPVMPPPERRDSSLPPGKRPRQPTLLGVSPVQRVAAAGAASAPEPAPAAGPASASAAGPAAASASGAASASSSVRPEEVELPRPGESEPPLASESLDVNDSYESPYRDSLPDVGPSAEVEDAEFEEPSPKAASSVRTSTPPPAYYDDDEDIPELPGRGTSPLRWLVIVVVVGALALIVSQWERVARLVGIGSDPALIAAGIAEGDAAVAEGHPTAYANAIEAYARAIEAGGDEDPEVLAKLSKAYALAAQAQLDGGAAPSSVEPLVTGASSTAQSAMELNRRDVSAKLAVADALRLTDEHTEARELLEEVRAISFSRTAEFFRVDARLSQAEADGQLENGLRSARQAVELEPGGVPYLLLAARAERAAGNPERARETLGKIFEERPEHPVATKLLAEWTAAAEAAVEAEAAAETEAAAEAAAETAAEAGPAPESAPAAAPVEEPKAVAKPAPVEPKVEAKPAPKPKAKAAAKKPDYDEYDRLAEAAGSDAFVDGRPPVLDYESNMKKGREELEAGNYARARAYFDSALEVHPGSADAMDALGDVATAVSDYGSALRYYRVAAQRGHPDGYFNLGRTYERLGRNEEAVSAYYTYVTRRPTGKHAAAARTAIKTLEPRAKLPPEPGDESEAQPEPPAQAPESTSP